jgi:hypothetical protein
VNMFDVDAGPFEPFSGANGIVGERDEHDASVNETGPIHGQ